MPYFGLPTKSTNNSNGSDTSPFSNFMGGSASSWCSLKWCFPTLIVPIAKSNSGKLILPSLFKSMAARNFAIFSGGMSGMSAFFMADSISLNSNSPESSRSILLKNWNTEIFLSAR